MDIRIQLFKSEFEEFKDHEDIAVSHLISLYDENFD